MTTTAINDIEFLTFLDSNEEVIKPITEQNEIANNICRYISRTGKKCDKKIIINLKCSDHAFRKDTNKCLKCETYTFRLCGDCVKCSK